MPKKTSYLKIGIFTISALALLAVAVLFFGLSSVFKPALECETYFNYSVQGLSVGGPVNFRGIKVGQVSAVNIPQVFAPNGHQMVRVEFFIFPDLLLSNPAATVEDARAIVQEQIKNNLMCYLSYQGVSGLGYLDLDYVTDNTAPEPVVAIESTRITVPSARGSVLTIGESLSGILKSLKTVDFTALNKSMTDSFNQVAALSESLTSNTENLAVSLTETLETIKTTTTRLGALASSLEGDFKEVELSKVTTELVQSLRQLRAVLTQAENILRAPRNTLPSTMDNLRVMSENFRDLSEMAKRYPSQVLFGQPPKQEVK
ncbi:MAG: MlaD family protein [Deltaproteobacteria bacterium]|jgi:phospholipid/cholesterol/gamma-HCH transport system substrate-binding protein/paraquat-inducible protein B|nr:MlaD family protein [Deltaproteobacteria bacterium]